jgi:hypothetical protein
MQEAEPKRRAPSSRVLESDWLPRCPSWCRLLHARSSVSVGACLRRETGGPAYTYEALGRSPHLLTEAQQRRPGALPLTKHDNLDIGHFCLLWFWNDDSIFNNRVFITR